MALRRFPTIQTLVKALKQALAGAGIIARLKSGPKRTPDETMATIVVIISNCEAAKHAAKMIAKGAEGTALSSETGRTTDQMASASGHKTTTSLSGL